MICEACETPETTFWLALGYNQFLDYVNTWAPKLFRNELEAKDWCEENSTTTMIYTYQPIQLEGTP